jgi:2-methylcitrate dehydratase PrpD
MMKPYQVGKVAFDAVISVELAQSGIQANPGILGEGGIAAALIQDGFAQVALPDFGAGWELLRNSTKAYPCQHGIHPTIDAARGLHGKIGSRRIEQVRVYVGPLLAGRRLIPATSHEARFSIPFCVAVGLTGRGTRMRDFHESVIQSPEIQRLMRCIEIVPVKGRKMYNAAVDVRLDTGELLEEDVPLGRGHPGRPLSTEERREKFFDLAEPLMGGHTQVLLDTLEAFPGDGRVEAAFAMVRAQLASGA